MPQTRKGSLYEAMAGTAIGSRVGAQFWQKAFFIHRTLTGQYISGITRTAPNLSIEYPCNKAALSQRVHDHHHREQMKQYRAIFPCLHSEVSA